MIKIKLSIAGSPKDFSFEEFLGSQDIAKEVKFFVNTSENIDFDFWFVIDDLGNEYESARVSPEGIYFFTSEVVHDPCYYDSYKARAFLGQFNKIFTSHDIYSEKAHFDLPYQGWMINANHGYSDFHATGRGIDYLLGIKHIEKTRPLSVICSNKVVTPYHKLRLKFVRALKEHFGERLDWFGNGISPISSKWDGVAPYKYHICIENKLQSNVITEKIFDSYLGLAFPIYSGAPNIAEFFSSDSFVAINIFDPYSAVNKIEEILVNNHYEDSLPKLLASRDTVLYEINPFIRMARIAIADYSRVSMLNRQLVRINSLVSRSKTRRIVRAIGRKVEKIGSSLSHMI